MNTTDLVAIQFGLAEDNTYLVTEGIDPIPCHNFWGDPSVGNTKNCSFTTRNVFGVPDSGFSTVAQEGNTFTVPQTNDDNNLFWLRYGVAVGDRWHYTLVEGGDAQEIPCNNVYFGFDPDVGAHKECQLGGTYTVGDGGINQCASEGASCNNIGTAAVLAKYGQGTGYNFRFISTGSGDMSCDNAEFGPDPSPGNHKFCYVQSLKPQNAATNSEWVQVQSCGGAPCNQIEVTIQVGSTVTNSTSSQESWSVTVTDSMEEGFSFEGESDKFSLSIAEGFANSDTMTQALETSKLVGYDVTCGPVKNPVELVMYQFETTTNAHCVEDATCSLLAQTHSYFCASSDSGPPPPPQCLPTYCKDAACQTCTYDD